MQEILKGQNCFLGINITQVGAVQNAVKIDTHIISPSGVVSCVANGYDELKKVVGLMISADLINELGAYSIDLRLVFADAVIIVPTFAFAEAVEGEVPCYGISEVYVKIEGGEVVPSGSTTVEFVNRKEFEQLSNKVDDLEEQIGSGGGASITIDTELSDTSNNAIANSAVTKGLRGKQDALTLETKPNGNIVIGNLAGQSKEFMPATPSGDPMHYAYEAVGAVWNANTGYWELNPEQGGLANITTSEMRVMYNEYSANWTDAMVGLFAYSKSRTNLLGKLVDWGWGYMTNNTDWMFLDARNMEVAYLAESSSSLFTLTNARGMFFRTHKLKTIIGVLDFTSASGISDMFAQCYALENVRCRNLKQSISFADSPLLSKESLLYMIRNSVQGAEFTITLHPDVYREAKDGEWAEEVTSAINDYGENITLAEA